MTSNEGRIAKNTLILYFRMLILMAVSLYTSRVVLDSLGVIDYGVYDVVGGFVAMFSLLSGALSTAISRFITFELGRNNNERISSVFSTSVTIQLLLALIVFVVAEVVGIWFLNTHMVIPDDRITAANYVYQFSLFTFCVQLISVPYNAAIIAHEKMQAFAFIGIFDAFGRLLVAFFIDYSPVDRLVFYAFLLLSLQILVRLIYGVYCNRSFKECRYHFFVDKVLMKEMFSFAGWTFIGSSAVHLRDQGGNILINIFWGPTLNAARGMAVQANNAVQLFVSNFMTALYPQITKSYASNDHEFMLKLVFQGARFSFYILLFISLPILFNTDFVLSLWLKDVPEHLSMFVKLFLILALSDSLSNTIIAAQSATGKIRNYQLVVGGVLLLNLPLVYMLFRLGFPAEISVVVSIVISQLCLFIRLYMFSFSVKLSILYFLKNVYFNVLTVTFISIIPTLLISNCNFPNIIMSFSLITLVSIVSTFLAIALVGCSHAERSFILTKIIDSLKRIR